MSLWSRPPDTRDPDCGRGDQGLHPCIVSSNLDEFFEVRVAGLMEQIKLGGITTTADGMSAMQTLKRVREQAHELIKRQYVLFNMELTPALADQGIKFLRRTHWTEAQQAWVKDYFFPRGDAGF